MIFDLSIRVLGSRYEVDRSVLGESPEGFLVERGNRVSCVTRVSGELLMHELAEVRYPDFSPGLRTHLASGRHGM